MDSLKKRLTQSGFDEDLLNLIPRLDWQRYPTMGQSKPLTDAGEQPHAQLMALLLLIVTLDYEAWRKMQPKAEEMFRECSAKVTGMVMRAVTAVLRKQYQKIDESLTPRAFRPPFSWVLSYPVFAVRRIV